MPDLKPELKFWPLDNLEVLGVPYIVLSIPHIHPVGYAGETEAAANLLL